MTDELLDHERLDAYRVALEFLVLALDVCSGLPRGNFELRDQFHRASTSIVLNIAEGTGKTGSADRARFYAIARGSTMGGSRQLLDVLRIDRPCGPSPNTRPEKTLLFRLVSMLTKMSR